MSGSVPGRLGHVRSAAAGASAWLRGSSRVAGAVVMAFHDVVDDGVVPVQYAVTLSRFRQQLDVVARLGLQVVSLRQLAASLRAGQDVTGQVALAFDDALLGVHRLALPELAGRGWPATLHVVTDQLGVDPPWWPGSQRTMSWPELEEAVAAGVDVAAHGTSHACLPCLGDRELAEELRAPRGRLEDLGGRAVEEVAYPFGHYDPRVREAVRAAGYTTAYSFLNGRVAGDADLWRLPRITVHQGLTAPRLVHQLARRPQDWPSSQAPSAHPHALSPA